MFLHLQQALGVAYVQVEPGYIYKISSPVDVSADRYIATSSDIPALNGTYDYLGSVAGGGDFYFRSPSNSSTYLYLSYSNYFSTITISREKITSMDGAVNDLVDNVGVDSIWNIFDISINYIYIVILVAFGIFIVTLVIKKITKGKEGF